jgi:hypothetical protein
MKLVHENAANNEMALLSLYVYRQMDKIDRMPS